VKFIKIDEEGYFFTDEGQRLVEPEYGAHLLSHLAVEDRGKIVTDDDGQKIVVEAFDEAIIALQVHKPKAAPFDVWQVQAPYQFFDSFSLKSLSVDDWDRFHGETLKGVPFVMSRAAQAAFFNLVDEFDDESITYSGVRYEVGPFLVDHEPSFKEDFWTNVYKTENPGWEIMEPAPALVKVLPSLKLPKLRVIVPAGGTGEDAAHFAQQGHIVTSVDISAEAIERGKKKFPNLPITWVQGDIFNLPASYRKSYDLVFEHACYAALPPSRRKQMIDLWRSWLTPGGHLLGVFFAMYKRQGPPFGGSEWEFRERLKTHFRFLVWKRWRESVPRREGRECLIYAQLK
jgi:hypothetical protein